MWVLYLVLALIFSMFLFCGFLLYNHKALWLLSGYNTMSKKQKEHYDKTHDMRAISRFVGNLCFVLAGYIFVLAFGIFLENRYVILISTGLILVISVACVIYVNTSKRFKK